MRVFHIQGDQFTELETLPEKLPPAGYLWVGSARREFEVQSSVLQAALQGWTGGQLVDLHISDLLNNQLPSHFDYTSWYDVLVFRRLAAGEGSAPMFLDDSKGTLATARAALAAIDTSPVGFALFDRVLLTVHPTDCQVREFFANRLQQQALPAGGDARMLEGRNAARLPASAADLMLRMVNHMVDSYLELRRLLTKQLTYLQQELFNPRSRFDNWQMLLESRNALHLLEDTCEDQRSAITEWIDALDEWPTDADKNARRERELLRVRSRDVLEHIERVLSHVRRLESSAETAVQMHFSAQSNRTNDIMRTLTVLTAIFMPLNLVTGFFGMNFEGLPLIHSMSGFWAVFMAMLVLGIGLSVFFWRKRYLGSKH
ncbi:MAG: magnesium transporter CorA family protein [Rhizobacter sp.]|nr:magnesium transporter CorA family protein [Rhizobacter sp.]MBP6268608.1 magnesium transporter CorA family protein [Rhizobacter sp.]